MTEATAPDSALLLKVVSRGPAPAADALDELDALCRSAGMTPVGRRIVRRPRPDAAHCVGSGVVEEVRARLEPEAIRRVVFDHPISAVQQRNLEKAWGVPVVDRTELIIEIFSQRARSSEGMLQVELARLEHQASRLVRMWSHLERQRGGIGLRGGPGERQIELDRRMLDERIRRLRQRLARTAGQRVTRRRARSRSTTPKVSLIGYTNAGKSTLFNRLTHAGTLAADQLFATLDPLTRRLHLGGDAFIVLSDTVGFVRDLPHGLVAAFRATLEEAAEADLLLHVVDASATDREAQIDAVNRVLVEIGADDRPQCLVLNKIDRTTIAPGPVTDPGYGRIRAFAVSALTGQGLDELRAWLAALPGTAGGAPDPAAPATAVQPEGSADLVSSAHSECHLRAGVDRKPPASDPQDVHVVE